MGTGKLSRRLFLLTFIALIPAAIVLFYNLYSIRLAKDEEVHADVLRTAQLAALEMQRIIGGAENVLVALSAAAVVQQQDGAGCQAYLKRIGARLPQFAGLAVADVRGVIICRLSSDGVGITISDRSYFRQALETGRFVVGEYSVGRLSQQPILPLALPIKSDHGNVFGVIVGALSLDWLGQRMRERNFSQNSALTVADSGGTIIARAPLPQQFVGTKVSARFARYVKADRPGTFRGVGRDGIDRIVGFYPAAATTYGLFVSTGVSTDVAYAAIRRTGWISLLATVASLVLSFVLAWFTSTELIRRPVDKLVTTIRDWRTGNETVRTGMSGRSGEFGVVGEAIDDFLSELAKARDAAAAAEERRELLLRELDHRVKNLVATVQSVARQTFRDSDHPEEAIRVFSQRLTAMSEAHGLLLKDDWQSAGMHEVVAAAIRPFVYEATPQFEVSGPNFPVRAKAVLSLSMALHELCTNAAKYGALKTGEGRIAIEWGVESGEGSGDGRFRLVWTERGGPPVSVPEKFGFGSKMIERVLSYELEAKVETQYAPTGVVFTLVAPLQRIRREREIRPFEA